MSKQYIWQKWATKRNGYSDGFLILARAAEYIGWQGEASLFLSRHAGEHFPTEMAAGMHKLPARVTS